MKLVWKRRAKVSRLAEKGPCPQNRQRLLGVQPGGRGRPSLVLGDRRSASAHVSAARDAHPVGSLIGVALDGDTRALRSAIVSDPASVLARRGRSLGVYKSPDGRPEEHRAYWAGKFDAPNPARRIHLPFLRLLVSRFWFSEFRDVRDSASGMPIGGAGPSIGSLAGCDSQAAVSLGKWEEGWLIETGALSHGSGSAMFRGRHIAMGELGEGDIGGAVFRTHSDHCRDSRCANIHAEIRNFREPGERRWKVLVVDDARVSAVTDTRATSESAVPDCLGVFYALSEYF